MDSTQTKSTEGGSASPPPAPPHFAVAGIVLDALSAHDFARFDDALDVDASMSALLPRGFREWQGASEICAQFERWFGDVDRFEVAEATVGQVGGLLQLTWRLRLKGERLGDEPMIVEQHVYAATGPGGRIERLSLLCSGFWEERVDG
jgi:hypothetical protein